MKNRLALRNKILISFLAIIVTESLSIFLGIKLTSANIISTVQDHVRIKLNATREMYNKSLAEIKDTVRLTAMQDFIRRRDQGSDTLAKLQQINKRESWDLCNIIDADSHQVLVRCQNSKKIGDKPKLALIDAVLQRKTTVVSTEVLTRSQLLVENEKLAARAYTKITPTPHSQPTELSAVDSGMFIMAAAPIFDSSNNIVRVLYAGRMLNYNYPLIDKIRDAIFAEEKDQKKEVGVVSIFLKNVRISTSMKRDKGVRAAGTTVDADVDKNISLYDHWNKRAFIVDDWYISAYEPIKNIADQNVGILGIGVLESKYREEQRLSLWIFIAIVSAGIVLSILICFLLTDSIMKPINRLLVATHNLASGVMDPKVDMGDAPREISELGQAFNFMVDSIQQRDRQLKQRTQQEIMKAERLAMIGRLSAGVAHEINNPLGGILLFSRLLLQKAPTEGLMRENLERIERDTKRCQNIVQGLLDFAREREPKIELVAINELVDKSIQLFKNQALFHNIDVQKQYEDLPIILADPAQIQQVLVNIIMNAADAMDEKGVLRLATRCCDNMVEIAITDNGKGIPAEQFDQIFEPFFTTKGVGHGTGLGLSISYGIIDRHGGDLKAFSKEGEGSTFIIRLPNNRENGQ